MHLKIFSTMRLIVIFSFFLLMCSKGFSQDQVVLVNGETLRGKAEVSISKIRDKTILNGFEIELSDIDKIVLETGEVFKPKKVTYYFEMGKSEEFRYAILKQVLVGSVNFYSYSGAEFNFAYEKDGEVIALQSIPNDIYLNSIKGFKEELRVLISDCLQQDRLNDISLSKDKLTFILNEYNLCKDREYKPLVSPKKRDHIFLYDLSMGFHQAKHSLSAPFFRFNSSRPVKVGDIDQEGVSTLGWVVDFSFKKNLFNSKNVFLYSGLAIKKYSFNVTSDNVTSGLSDFEFIEGNYMLGLHYQRELFNKVLIGTSSGLFAWTTKIQDNIFYNSGRFPVIPDYTAKSGGVGVFAQASITYNISDQKSFFANIRGSFRDGENMFSSGLVRIETSTVQNDDALQDLYTVLFGFRIKVVKRNYLK